MLVRQGDHNLRCQVALGGVVELERCISERVVYDRGKGPGFERPTRIELSAALVKVKTPARSVADARRRLDFFLRDLQE